MSMAGRGLYRRRPVPQRTCFACRAIKAKGELVRIVRTPGGSVDVDEAGKRSGRGAYLCRSWECWERGLKKGQLAHHLKTSLDTEYVNRLWEYARSMKPAT